MQATDSCITKQLIDRAPSLLQSLHKLSIEQSEIRKSTLDFYVNTHGHPVDTIKRTLEGLGDKELFNHVFTMIITANLNKHVCKEFVQNLHDMPFVKTIVSVTTYIFDSSVSPENTALFCKLSRICREFSAFNFVTQNELLSLGAHLQPSTDLIKCLDPILGIINTGMLRRMQNYLDQAKEGSLFGSIVPDNLDHVKTYLIAPFDFEQKDDLEWQPTLTASLEQ